MRKVTLLLLLLALLAPAPALAGGRGVNDGDGNVGAGAGSSGSNGSSGNSNGGAPKPGNGGGAPDGGLVNTDGCTSGDFTDTECGAAYAPDAPAPEVNPGQLAQNAFDARKLPAPRIRMSPETPNPAIVGLQTWLWVEGGAWGDQKAEAEAGDAKVTTTAKPISIVWDMGPKKVICYGPGRPWKKGLGQKATTSCGYTYRHSSKKQPGGKYQVRVYLQYSVSWKCKGDDCDDETEGDLGTAASPATTADIRVTERQTVVR